MATPPRILRLEPDLRGLSSLQGHRGHLDGFGKKLDDKLKQIRSAEVLFGVKKGRWEQLQELTEEILANNRAMVILTEGLTERVIRASLSVFDSGSLERPDFTVKVVSSSLGSEALARLADDLKGRSVCLCVAFHDDPSPRLLWCYRLLYSRLATGRSAEELRRRVFLATGESSSHWGAWARKSGFRTLVFPEGCAGRYLFFSEPIGLFLSLIGISAWQCVEGGRSFYRQFEKASGIEDPLLAYSALREVHLSDRARETLMVPDESFGDFAVWWRALGEDSRQEFGSEGGVCHVLIGAVMEERSPEHGREWITEVRIEGEAQLQVEALEEGALDPWPDASKRHWEPLEPHYERALDLQREDSAHAAPSVRLRLRCSDALSIGALFAFVEGSVSVCHKLAEIDDHWDLLRARSLTNVLETPV